MADRALQELAVSDDGHVVVVRPELVVEIALDGVQASKRYSGGVALRFARVRGYRADKAPATPTPSTPCARSCRSAPSSKTRLPADSETVGAVGSRSSLGILCPIGGTERQKNGRGGRGRWKRRP